MSLLSLRSVGLRFGGIVALDDFTMDVNEGQIVGLIGPNGAGKTTAFNVITRIYQPDAGQLEFDGESLLKTNAPGIVRRGIGRTFQNLELFPTMTVLEHVLIGAHTVTRFQPERKARALAMETIEYVGLKPVAKRPAVGLPFATLKRVELARALASKPRLLLLDEPAGGLNHEELADLGRFIQDLRDDRKITVLLVEHHMSLVMSVSDYVYVLNFGRMLSEGVPTEVQRDPKVIEAYLGGEVDATQSVAEAAMAAEKLAQEIEEA
jgi:branched-chain amino acid transport system ATP-binding protein